MLRAGKLRVRLRSFFFFFRMCQKDMFIRQNVVSFAGTSRKYVLNGFGYVSHCLGKFLG